MFYYSKIKNIINNTSKNNNEAIIIIQSDHGPRPNSAGNKNDENAFKVMNAIYFPDMNYGMLYDSISPVDTIRLMLNYYFGVLTEIDKNLGD